MAFGCIGPFKFGNDVHGVVALFRCCFLTYQEVSLVGAARAVNNDDATESSHPVPADEFRNPTSRSTCIEND